MRAPCAEKLAELRAACDRIIQAPEKRKAMTPARKRRIWEAHMRLCMQCGQPVAERGPTVIYDHEIPLDLGGSDDDGNIGPIHANPCNKVKTAADMKAIAKMRRLHGRDDGTRRQRRPIPGKPLRAHPTHKRRMDGSVVRRTKTESQDK